MEGVGQETRHGSELPSVLIVCGFPQEVTSPLSLKISVSGRDSQLDQKIRYFWAVGPVLELDLAFGLRETLPRKIHRDCNELLYVIWTEVWWDESGEGRVEPVSPCSKMETEGIGGGGGEGVSGDGFVIQSWNSLCEYCCYKRSRRAEKVGG